MSLPVAIEYTSALEQGGGIGRYTRELIGALARQDSSTPYFLFASGQTKERRLSLPGSNFEWKLTRIQAQWLARLWHRARLPVPIEYWTGPIALLHAPDFTLPPVKRGTRTLLTVHDLSFIRTPETAARGLRAYLEKAVPHSIARADHVLADSESTKQDVIELFRTSAEKVSVLYSGVSSRFVPITDARTLQGVRARYGLGDRSYILSVGTIQPRKNYLRLLEAFKQIDRPDLDLVIAGGRGWLENLAYRQAQESGLGDRIRFLGFVDDSDLPALYSAAQLFVFPSLYEGFGLPVLEAMACGIPVVTSNVSSLPEIAGDAALLVDPYDIEMLASAITEALEDQAVREKLVSRGTERARQFTWSRAAQQLLQHYKALLN